MDGRKARAFNNNRHLGSFPLGANPSGIVRWLAVVDTVVVAAVIAIVASEIPLSSFRARLALMLLVPAYQALFQTFGLYESHRMQGFSGALRSLLTAEFAGAILSVSGALVLGRTGLIPAFIALAVVNTIIIAIGRFALYITLSQIRRRGLDSRYVCIIGTWERASQIHEVLANRPEWGMSVSIVGLTLQEGGHQFVRFPSREDLGGDLSAVLHREVVDEVAIAVPPERLATERPTIAVCEQFGVLGRVMLDYQEEEELSTPLQGEISFAHTPMSHEHLFLKRLLDIGGASFGILLTCIPMTLIVILIRLSSRGPAVFKQKRTGLNGREFTIFKFRTMVDGAETAIIAANRSITKGPIFKDVKDYRITDVGHFLRRYSLDELPQFFNVLLGDMSLVGPRPLPVREANAIAGPHRRRFRVPPGVTGVWQVSGRSDVEFERWMKYDLDYVDNWSLALDLKVLLKTVPVVFAGKGAY